MKILIRYTTVLLIGLLNCTGTSLPAEGGEDDAAALEVAEALESQLIGRRWRYTYERSVFTPGVQEPSVRASFHVQLTTSFDRYHLAYQPTQRFNGWPLREAPGRPATQWLVLAERRMYYVPTIPADPAEWADMFDAGRISYEVPRSAIFNFEWMLPLFARLDDPRLQVRVDEADLVSHLAIASEAAVEELALRYGKYGDAGTFVSSSTYTHKSSGARTVRRMTTLAFDVVPNAPQLTLPAVSGLYDGTGKETLYRTTDRGNWPSWLHNCVRVLSPPETVPSQNSPSTSKSPTGILLWAVLLGVTACVIVIIRRGS